MEARSSRWPWRKKSTQTPPPNHTFHKQEMEQERESKPNYEKRSQSLSENHAEIAEEAVSGWQKAEAEGARYKQQLEEALEEKDRLDKCMTEMESQNTAIITSLAHITEEKDKAETEVHSLYLKITGLFKENSRLKYELHLLNKELQIRSDEKYTRLASTSHNTSRSPLVIRNTHLPMGTIDKYHDLSNAQMQLLDEVLRSSSNCDPEPNLASINDADEASCARSWASAMIAELEHFRKDKALMLHHDHEPKSMDLDFSNIDYLTEVESIAPCSQEDKTRSHKQEIEVQVQAADREKQWSSRSYANNNGNSSTASRFCISITETVKLVKALAHPLLKLGETDTKKSNKNLSGSTKIFNESDLQLHIEKLEVIKEKAMELGSASANTSLSWAAVDFLEELVGVLNRLVKIALYRNAQRDGCSDADDDEEDADAMSGLASVSQHNYAVAVPFNDCLAHHFLCKDDQHVFIPSEESKDFPLRKQVAQPQDKEIQNHFKMDLTAGSAKCNDAIQQEKPTKKKDSDRRWRGEGGETHPHLITNSNSNSKLFDFNSNYIKSAIRSTISRSRSKPSISSSHPSTSKPPNKLLNRLLSFS